MEHRDKEIEELQKKLTGYRNDNFEQKEELEEAMQKNELLLDEIKTIKEYQPTKPTFRAMQSLSNASDEGDDQAIRIPNLENELLARKESQESGEGEERTDESSRTLEMGGSARSTTELRITSRRSASIDMERMKNLEKEVEELKEEMNEQQASLDTVRVEKEQIEKDRQRLVSFLSLSLSRSVSCREVMDVHSVLEWTTLSFDICVW